MRVAIVGAGRIGGTLGRAWTRAGHDVVLSFARDEARLRALAGDIGARADTPAAAGAFGEVILFAPPWAALEAAVAQVGSLDGRIVIDTTNPFSAQPALPDGSSAGEEVARRLTGARLVKAYNTLEYTLLTELAGRTGRDRVLMPLCGDDAAAKRVVAGLIEDSGFAAIDRGPLAAAGGQEPGSVLFNHPFSVEDGVPEATAARMSADAGTLQERNLATARRFVDEVLVAQDPAAFDELVADDVVVHSGISPLAAMRDKEGFRAGLGSLAAFTFTGFELEDLLAVEGRVIARYRATATHTGDQLGVAATGKDVVMWELRLMRFREDRLVEDFVADINYDWPWLVAPAYPDGVGRTGLDVAPDARPTQSQR